MPTKGSWRHGTAQDLLAAVRARGASPRKCRLHGVACCRLVAAHITHPDCVTLIGLVERLADDASHAPAVAKLRRAVARWAGKAPQLKSAERDWYAHWVAWALADPKIRVPPLSLADSPKFRDLLGEVYGPREGGSHFRPAWRTGDVVSLAAGMYESRDFSAMPILADALQDAGCEDDAVLAHCREPGAHVRGCWVVDGVLGKG